MRQMTRDGRLTEREDGQDRLLAALYGCMAGRLLLKPLTAPVVSRAVGRVLSSRISRVLISGFVRRNRIDMTQFEDREYRSYNDFFCRKIRPGVRPIDREPSHLISPCDSKLTVLPIAKDLRFSLKHTEYTVGSLLKDEGLAAEYAGGYALIFRLTVDDYHRYGYVADGTEGPAVRIPGVLHTVNPIANDYFPIYKENSREYSVLHTEQFGDILMMEVGALMVGKIVNLRETETVRRGQEKGYFQFGGSTVVLLIRDGCVEIDGDILKNSRKQIETVVKYGEKIGVSCL